MNLTLVQDASAQDEPVTLAQAKAYLKVDIDDDDATIQSLITAARLEAENEYGRELPRKQWTLALDAFPTGVGYQMVTPSMPPPYGNLQYGFSYGPNFIELLDPLYTVDTFQYMKSDGTVVTMVENTDFLKDVLKHPGLVCPMFGQTWPTDDLWPSSAVQITFQAGYAPGTVPANLVQGMLLLTSQWYSGRIPFEAIRFVAELPFSVTSLFRNGKLWRF